MKQPYRHVQIRLSDGDLQRLKASAVRNARTISEEVRALLFVIIHKLQTGRSVPADLMTMQWHRAGATSCKIDVNVPIIMLDYCKLNGYKLTSCLLFALYHETDIDDPHKAAFSA